MSEHTKYKPFLLNGLRLKLSFHEVVCEECGAENDRVTCEPLGMYAQELNGAWVALVPAENDRHLYIEKLSDQRDELLAALKEAEADICRMRACGQDMAIASIVAPKIRIAIEKVGADETVKSAE